MEYFSKLNVLLDQGWKMTDSVCDKCKMSNVYSLEKSLMRCAGCGLQSTVEVVTQEEAKKSNLSSKISNSNEKDKSSFEICGETQNDFTDDNYWGSTQKTKTDDVSKKLSEKLLQGWCMMEECCPDCYVPIMKSKKGVKLCVDCGQEFGKVKTEEKVKEVVSQPTIVKETPISPIPQQIQPKATPQPLQNNSLSPQDEILKENLISSLLSITNFYSRKLKKADLENDEASIEKGLASLCKLIILRKEI